MKEKVKHYKQIANFSLREIEVSEGKKIINNYIDIKAISGTWSIRITDELPLYAFFNEALTIELNEGQYGYVHSIISVYYTITTMIPDNTFMEEFVDSFNAQLMRERPELSEATKETAEEKAADDKILDEEREKYNALQSIKDGTSE